MGQCFPLLVETDNDLLGLGFGPIGSGNYLIHGNREVIDGKCFIVGLRDQLDLGMLVTLLWKERYGSFQARQKVVHLSIIEGQVIVSTCIYWGIR